MRDWRGMLSKDRRPRKSLCWPLTEAEVSEFCYQGVSWRRNISAYQGPTQRLSWVSLVKDIHAHGLRSVHVCSRRMSSIDRGSYSNHQGKYLSLRSTVSASNKRHLDEVSYLASVKLEPPRLDSYFSIHEKCAYASL